MESEFNLGAIITKMFNSDANKCWVMDSDKYCESAVKNVVMLFHKIVQISFCNKIQFEGTE